MFNVLSKVCFIVQFDTEAEDGVKVGLSVKPV